MADITNAKPVITPPTEKLAIPLERGKFNNLILANPNYFGTFPKFGGKVVKKQSGDTTFEELKCLGLNPTGTLGTGLLEAVVDIKQHSGYGTDACAAGTTEFVRFFVRDATGWHDLGLSTVTVYDLSGPLPLSYSVSVDFKEARKFCLTENIVQVRAILSWQWEPTAGDPDFIPVWGNVVDANVQVAPLFLFEVPIADLIAEKELSIPPEVLKQVDAKQSLPATPPQPLSYGELKSLYADKKVPGHRFGFTDALKASKAALAQTLPSLPVPGPQVASLAANVPAASPVSVGLLAGAELGAILAGIEQTNGDTTFEQLTWALLPPIMPVVFKR